MPTTRTRPAKKRKRGTLISRMEKAGPSRAKLRKLVKKQKPSQSWYEQTDNPFESAS